MSFMVSLILNSNIKILILLIDFNCKVIWSYFFSSKLAVCLKSATKPYLHCLQKETFIYMINKVFINWVFECLKLATIPRMG